MMRLGILVFLFLISCGTKERRAKEFLELGDYKRAINLYNQLVDQSPSSFEARYGLGLSYYQKAYAFQDKGSPSIELWEMAIEELQYAYRIGTRPSLKLNLSNAYYRLAIIHDQNAKVALARKNLEQSLLYNSSHVHALHRLGTIAYEAHHFTEGREIFQRVLDIDPKFVAAYQNLGSCLWAMKKVDKALQIWEAGLKIDPDDSFLLTWKQKAMEYLKGQP